MKPAPFRYLRAATVDDTLQALADNPDARILAGGQSLIAMMNLRLIKPACLIDINRIPDLGYIREEGESVAIGALARHNDVKHSPLVGARCPLLTEAYESIAHHTVRNRGTLGGNLCHADPSSETPAVMIAVGATLVLRSLRGSREVAAEDFFLGTYETAAQQDEMLVEIRIPGMGSDGWAFAEISNRHGDFRHRRDRDDAAARQRPLRGGARGGEPGSASTRRGLCRRRRRSSAGPSTMRASIARQPRPAGAVDPHSDSHADAAYRREAIAALTRRTLRRAVERCS